MEPAQARECVWMLRAQTHPHPHPYPLGVQDAASRLVRGLPHPAGPSRAGAEVCRRGEVGGSPVPGWPGTGGDLRWESWRISCSSAKVHVPAAAVRGESRFYDFELSLRAFGIN